MNNYYKQQKMRENKIRNIMVLLAFSFAVLVYNLWCFSFGSNTTISVAIKYVACFSLFMFVAPIIMALCSEEDLAESLFKKAIYFFVFAMFLFAMYSVVAMQLNKKEMPMIGSIYGIEINSVINEDRLIQFRESGYSVEESSEDVLWSYVLRHDDYPNVRVRVYTSVSDNRVVRIEGLMSALKDSEGKAIRSDMVDLQRHFGKRVDSQIDKSKWHLLWPASDRTYYVTKDSHWVNVLEPSLYSRKFRNKVDVSSSWPLASESARQKRLGRRSLFDFNTNVDPTWERLDNYRHSDIRRSQNVIVWWHLTGGYDLRVVLQDFEGINELAYEKVRAHQDAVRLQKDKENKAKEESRSVLSVFL